MQHARRNSTGHIGPIYSAHIGNIAFGVTEGQLIKAFSEAGKVCSVFINPCYQSEPNGRAFTYGFVRYRTMEEVRQAVDLLNNWPMLGREIRVSIANAHKPKRDHSVDNFKRYIEAPRKEEVFGFNHHMLDELEQKMSDLGLKEDFPYLLNELKDLDYELPAKFKEECEPFTFTHDDLKYIQCLIKPDDVKKPPIGRLYSNKDADFQKDVKLPMAPGQYESSSIQNEVSPPKSNESNFLMKTEGSFVIGRGRGLHIVDSRTLGVGRGLHSVDSRNTNMRNSSLPKPIGRGQALLNYST